MVARPGALSALLSLLVVGQAPPIADLVVSPRMHHLRSEPAREWAEFPAQAEGAELTLDFDSTANLVERTLRLRQRDVKQVWRVAINGQDVARLPQDEAAIVNYVPLPAGTLRDGRNTLRVSSADKASDDVLVGEIAIVDRPARDVVQDATVDVVVREEPGGQPIPSRVTVADQQGALVSLGNASDADHAVRPGVVYSRTGAVRLKLPAGRYVIYAGRGFEYGVARADIDVTRGASVSRALTIRREVNTAGWAAMDTHLHTGAHARHGDATVEERMLTLAGEGVELPVSTEHNTRIDLDAPARAAGVRQHFTPIAGVEVTTPALGHFNVFPMSPNAPAIDHRAPDWERLGASIAAAASGAIVVLNHGLDDHGGFRPLVAAPHGRQLPANAMEVMNSGAVLSDPLALPREWMKLLNRGLRLTPMGSSDSHDVSRYIVGQGRTYVRVDDRDPGALDVSRAVESVRAGRVLVSYGLLTEIDVDGHGPGDVVRPRGDLDVRIRVQGPAWTQAQHVALYANGAVVREASITPGAQAGVKWEATWRIPKPTHDTSLVALATGPGVTAPYWPTAKPYQPTSTEFTPYVLGMTGAVFVDATPAPSRAPRSLR